MDGGAGRVERAASSLTIAATCAADRHVARALAARLAGADRPGFARRFVATVVAFFARVLELRLRARASGDDGGILDPSAAMMAAELGERIAVGPDEAPHRIGAIYTALLPDEDRSRDGVYYTPGWVVDRILDMVLEGGTDWHAARVVDPACGCGAFLTAVSDRMIAASVGEPPAQTLRSIGDRLRGFELDPFAAWLAQAMLDVRLAGLARQAGEPVPVMVEARDSLDLRSADEAAFGLVVGNPPYGRVTPLPAQRAAFARSTYGHANLYGLFTDAALRWAAPGGLVAYVTPTSMLSGLYYKSLRSLLTREAPPVAVELVSERSGVFEDVLQETMLAVYRRGLPEPRGGGRVSFLSLGADGAVVSCAAGTFALPRDPRAPWLLPRMPGQVALARRLRDMPHRLADYGYGVSTGPLVWNRHKAQFRAAVERGAYPVVWAEAVAADGRFVWRAQRRNHAPWFAADLPRDRPLLVDRPCVLLQRTTAKEQARRLIAAELPAAFVREHGAVVVENHLNMVRPVVAEPAVPVAAIAALLNSAAADAAFRCMNGSVAVSAFELEAMPMPPPAVMRRLAELATAGAPRAEVEVVVAAAYAEAAPTDLHAAAAA